MTYPGSSTLKRQLEAVLPDYLHTCRWYGDKSEEITSADWVELGAISFEGSILVNGLVSVQLETGEKSWYALPVVVDSHWNGVSPILRLHLESGEVGIFDAIEHPLFAHWIVRLLKDPEHADWSGLGARWSPTTALSHFGPIPDTIDARVSRAEQSNSSIVFGNQIMVKVFRKLRSGVNPDVEVGRFLTEETSFESMPAVLGELLVSLPDDGLASLGVAQQFLDSEADGWNYALGHLQNVLNEEDTNARQQDNWSESVQLLGSTIADLHLELASSKRNRDFAPEPIENVDVTRWEEELRSSLSRVQTRLQRIKAPEPALDSLIAAFDAAAPNLSSRAAGFERLLGCSKIRVHGDLHLGQTLRSRDGRFIILDFEGEPSRPLEERRSKSSPLKDVAGMFRSFNYARGVAERTSPDQGATRTEELVGWERETRQTFLGSYLDRAKSDHARFLPDSSEDIREALAAWELHKALYEVLYELDNRPTWLSLPLAATLKLA